MTRPPETATGCHFYRLIQPCLPSAEGFRRIPQDSDDIDSDYRLKQPNTTTCQSDLSPAEAANPSIRKEYMSPAETAKQQLRKIGIVTHATG